MPRPRPRRPPPRSRRGRAPRPSSAPSCSNRAADLLDAALSPSSSRWCRPRPAPRCGSPRQMQVPQAARPLPPLRQGHRASELDDPGRRRASCPPRRWRRAASSAASPAVRPVGVVACITSYNFPMTNMAGKIGPALAMGNTVVVKPAPQDPLAIVRLGEVFDEAGFPPGVVNVVVGRGPRGRPRRWSPRRTSTWSASPARTVVGQRIGAGRRPRHEAPAARARRQGRRASSSTTPTSRPPSAPSPACGPSTPARSAPRRPGCSPSGASTTSSSPGSAPAAGHLKVGDPLETRHRARPGHHRGPPRPRRGLRRLGPRAGRHRRRRRRAPRPRRAASTSPRR